MYMCVCVCDLLVGNGDGEKLVEEAEARRHVPRVGDVGRRVRHLPPTVCVCVCVCVCAEARRHVPRVGDVGGAYVTCRPPQTISHTIDISSHTIDITLSIFYVTCISQPHVKPLSAARVKRRLCLRCDALTPLARSSRYQQRVLSDAYVSAATP